MVTPAEKYAVSVFRRSPTFRALAMVVLVVSFGLEILSCAFVECVAAAPTERNGRDACLESLQVCDDHNSSFNVLFDKPVFLLGTPCLFLSPAVWWYSQNTPTFAPDGFPATIDHPPQLSL